MLYFLLREHKQSSAEYRKLYDCYYYSDVDKHANLLVKRDTDIGILVQKSIQHQHGLVALLENKKLMDVRYRFK